MNMILRNWTPSRFDYHVVGSPCPGPDGQPIVNAFWAQADRTLVVCCALVNTIENIARPLVEKLVELLPANKPFIHNDFRHLVSPATRYPQNVIGFASE
jgi:hypothetical protein